MSYTWTGSFPSAIPYLPVTCFGRMRSCVLFVRTDINNAGGVGLVCPLFILSGWCVYVLLLDQQMSIMPGISVQNDF